MREIVMVAIGGAAGATLRYLIGIAVGTRFEGSVPWHTFGINVVGAFLLGLLMAVALHRSEVPVTALLLLGTGLLGGFTTFSTLAYESISLIEKEAWGYGLAYMFGTGVAGLVAAAAGLALGRSI